MSLTSLLILDFWKIIETNCVQILDAGYNPKRIYTENQNIELVNHWKTIYDEFFDARSNKASKYDMSRDFELHKLSLMLEMLYDMENRCIILIGMADIAELRKFVTERTSEVIRDFKDLYPKVKINMFSDTTQVLDIVQQVIKSQTNIFDEKSGTKAKEIKKEVKSIYAISSQMGIILGFNLNINTMTCAEFIGHEQVVEEKIKQDNEHKIKK